MFSYRTIFTVAFIEQIRSLHVAEHDDDSWDTWVDPCKHVMPADDIYDAYDACYEELHPDPCKDEQPDEDNWTEGAWDAYDEC